MIIIPSNCLHGYFQLQAVFILINVRVCCLCKVVLGSVCIGVAKQLHAACKTHGRNTAFPIKEIMSCTDVCHTCFNILPLHVIYFRRIGKDGFCGGNSFKNVYKLTRSVVDVARTSCRADRGGGNITFNTRYAFVGHCQNRNRGGIA